MSTDTLTDERVKRLGKVLTARAIAGSEFAPTWRDWLDRFTTADSIAASLLRQYLGEDDLVIDPDWKAEALPLDRARTFKQQVLWPRLAERALLHEAEGSDPLPS